MAVEHRMGNPSFPKVSIIMSAHNGSPYLSHAIDSVLSQTYTNFELLIANDASTDDTPDILDQYAAHDDRVSIIHFQKNIGLVEALNHLLTIAQGELLARMDADDVCLPTRIERQVSAFCKDDSLSLLGTHFDYIDSHGRVFAKGRPPHSNDSLQTYLMNEGNPFCHPSVMMRTPLIKSLGGYRQIVNRYAQDYDLFLRLAELGTIGNLDEVLMHYRIHEGQITVQKMRPQLRSAFIYQELARDRRAGHFESIEEAIKRADSRRGEMAKAIAKGALYWARLMEQQGNIKAAKLLLTSAFMARPTNLRIAKRILSIHLKH